MNKIISEINKLSFPATILIVGIILGSFYLSTQIIKQSSIERQQDRNYIAERKDSCYDLFYREKEKWSNTERYWYDENTDKCMVQYSVKEKDYEISRKECEDLSKSLTHKYRPDLSGFGASYCEITTFFTKEF
jgi:hypothetical protein